MDRSGWWSDLSNDKRYDNDDDDGKNDELGGSIRGDLSAVALRKRGVVADTNVANYV